MTKYDYIDVKKLELMEKKELFDFLKRYGFDEYSLQIYLSTLQSPVSVGVLAEKTKLDRGKAYRSINKLKTLGVVETTISSPTIVYSVKPKQALENIIKVKELEIKLLENNKEEIIKSFSQFVIDDESIPQTNFKVIQGRFNVYHKIYELLENAENDVFLVSPIKDIIAMSNGTIYEAIQICKKNGNKVNIITNTDVPKEINIIKKLNPTEIRIRKLFSQGRIVATSNQFILSNDEIDKMSLSNDSDCIVNISSKAMNDNILGLCKSIWKSSKCQ